MSVITELKQHVCIFCKQKFTKGYAHNLFCSVRCMKAFQFENTYEDEDGIVYDFEGEP